VRCSPDGPPGPIESFYCPFCERNVDVGFIESHVASNTHHKKVEQNDYIASMRTREKNNECDNAATEEHLLSQKHKKRLKLNHLQLADGLVQQSLPDSSTASSSVTCMPCRPVQPVGDPIFFEWKPDFSTWWCKLCWKQVDDNHLLSRNHQKRVYYQLRGINDYLRESSVGVQAALPNYSDAAPTSTTPVPAITEQPRPDGDPEWYYWRQDMLQWFCRLCRRFADQGHVMGKEHKKRVGYQEMGINYLEPSPYPNRLGGPPPQRTLSTPSCGIPAPHNPRASGKDEHDLPNCESIASRSTLPMTQGADTSSQTSVLETTVPLDSAPPVVEWERYFSKEHGEHYYVHLRDRTRVQWSIGSHEPYLALF